MFFRGRKEWEFDNPMMRALGEDGSEYWLIELTVNLNLFHVFIEGKHFIFGGIDQVLSLINAEGVKKYRVGFQPQFLRNRDWSISTLKEVYEAKDLFGQRAFIFVCADGKRYIDSDIENTEEDLKDRQRIYFWEEGI